MFNGQTLPTQQLGCGLAGAAGKLRKQQARMTIQLPEPVPPAFAPPFVDPKAAKKARKAAKRATQQQQPTAPPGGLIAPGGSEPQPGSGGSPAPAGGEGEDGGGGFGGISDFLSGIPPTYLYIGLAIGAFMLLKKR